MKIEKCISFINFVTIFTSRRFFVSTVKNYTIVISFAMQALKEIVFLQILQLYNLMKRKSLINVLIAKRIF